MARANVRVRPATADDVDGLVQLLGDVDLSRGLFSGRPLAPDGVERVPDRVLAIVNGEEGRDRTLTVAVDEPSGTVLGLLITRCDEVGVVNLMRVLNITHLLVAPKARRRGVGRALLASAVHMAEHGDYSHVVATVATNSREANRYLARLGFAPLVSNRIAATSSLRKTLGLSDTGDGLAAVRRSRLLRARAGRLTGSDVAEQALRSGRVARGA